MSYPSKVKIVEVGPRDGLQNEKDVVPTDDKIRFINLLNESGLPVIEATSFVSPKWVPQLADAAQVYANIEKRKGARYPVLVPNLKGLERALDSGVKDIAVFTAASETFNRKNINMSIDDSLAEIRLVVAEAREHGMAVRGYVSTCYSCPYEGKMAPGKVAPVIADLFKTGVEEVSIGDTIGAAVPTDVERLLGMVFKDVPVEKVAVHFHDTRGTALANILQALQMGVAVVDASAGGLGGCPYAPGASGNVATEDVLHMLDGMGIETGVSLEKVVEASRFIGSVLKRPLPSKYLQACRA
ncbi:MAG TPA: hydroxymethylglutaryl-CoA lyase [bacterium]|nr:hydroxymethylglutaryl-CoA lyase [bacterium]